MSNVAIAFYVVGALVTVYIVAASWQSSDRDGVGMRPPLPTRTMDRRAAHWWRARRLGRR